MKTWFCVLLILGSSGAWASENESQTSLQTPSPVVGAVPPAATTPEDQNNRLRALEGSKSKWSGQIQMSYSGSTIDHPFSADAPNPGGLNPPPVVSLSGLLQGRYRRSETQSLGFGFGLTSETPFQGPKNTTLADPTVDWAFSQKMGALHNRVDLYANAYTANYEIKYGDAWGLTVLDDLIYKFPGTKFTLGLSGQADWNAFSGTTDANGNDIQGAQRDLDYGFYPTAEYQLTQRLNLRSVMGFVYEHDRDLAAMTFVPKRIYQTAGLGVSFTDDLFTYFFVQFYPSPVSSLSHNDTSVGFSAIINLL